MAAHSPADQLSAPTPLWVQIIKWASMALVVLAAFGIATRLSQNGSGAFLIVLTAFVAMCVVVVYATRRNVPLKYLLPGLLLLLGLQVWPIIMTVSTAFTNYGDGHALSKEDATNAIIAQSVQQVPDSPRYKLSVAVKEGGDKATAPLAFLLTDPQGKTFVGDQSGLKDLPADGLQKTDSGKITAAPGWTILNAREVNARKDLAEFAVPSKDGAGIKASGLSDAYEGKTTVTYDEKTDTLTDSATKKVYVAKDAKWVPKDGQGDAYTTGWTENVGLKNFTTVLTDPTLRGGFFKIFFWNIAFSAISVFSTFILGMLLALLFNDPRLKGKGFYRSLLILPYAIPGFVTALLWQSMFNQDYGLVNGLTGLHIDWLGNEWAGKAAILIANLWLGFPYMFLITTGALQSIPGDVKEAAKIDGANPIQTLSRIIMPLLLVAVGPLLIASFAFNFNNFGLIYLLTGGGPFVEGNTSVGSTDLLITFAYRVAFSGVSPNQGLAAAVSIFIFAIVAGLSYAGFRRTKGLEEIN
jgi:arabinogalactan oligomer/maltooligosaccharide transport system permease protein